MTDQAPLEAELGRDNRIILGLAELDSTWPSPPPLPAGPGLYALYDKNHPARELYIGRSLDVQRRVGQLFGAALTGARGLHSAGYKIGNGKAAGGVKVAAADLVVHVWAGQEAYDREAALIGRYGPPYNKQHVARGPLTLKEPLGGTLYVKDRAPVWALLSAEEQPKGRWSKGGWKGRSAACTQHTDRSYFLGWNGTEQAVGLWVTERGVDIFPTSAGDSVAKTVEELKHVIDRWLEQRDEARQADAAAT